MTSSTHTVYNFVASSPDFPQLFITYSQEGNEATNNNYFVCTGRNGKVKVKLVAMLQNKTKTSTVFIIRDSTQLAGELLHRTD